MGDRGGYVVGSSRGVVILPVQIPTEGVVEDVLADTV